MEKQEGAAVKSFPVGTELTTLVPPRSTAYHVLRLDNFRLLEYEVAARDDGMRA